MEKKKCFLMTVVIILAFSSFSFSQSQEEGFLKRLSLKPGISFELFNRTLSWDEDKYTSNLKSYIFTFNADFKIQEGFWASAILGYSLSNFDSLVFREIPFSMDLQAGGIGGFFFGGEIKKSFISTQNIEIEVLGQFVFYFGNKEEWDIPDLNVEGNVVGKPSWTRGMVGPVIKYLGYEKLHPYLFINYNKLRGTFTMEQSIQDLEGTEEKKIAAKSNFSISIGTIYELSSAFSVKAEVSVMPYSGGVDYGGGVDFGFMFKTLFSL